MSESKIARSRTRASISNTTQCRATALFRSLTGLADLEIVRIVEDRTTLLPSVVSGPQQQLEVLEHVERLATERSGPESIGP